MQEREKVREGWSLLEHKQPGPVHQGGLAVFRASVNTLLWQQHCAWAENADARQARNLHLD